MPSWVVIPSKVSLEVKTGRLGSGKPTTFTCATTAGSQGHAGGRLSEIVVHEINGRKLQDTSLSGFPLKFFIYCTILIESARKQKATASFFCISGAICSFPPFSSWTPAVRQLDSWTCHSYKLLLCALGLTVETVLQPPYSCSFHPTVWTRRTSGSL